MKLISHYIVTVAIALGVGILAWTIRGTLEPPPEIVTRIEYRDRPLAERDTADATPPDIRYVYRVQRDTVNICAGDTVIAVPTGFTPVGVVSEEPVRVRGQNVTLTFWRPDSLRWIQNRYRIRPPRRALWLDVGSAYSAGVVTVAGRANVRIRRLYAHAGYQIGAEGQTGPTFGLHYRLLGWNY